VPVAVALARQVDSRGQVCATRGCCQCVCVCVCVRACMYVFWRPSAHNEGMLPVYECSPVCMYFHDRVRAMRGVCVYV
jgi:hypothetical protein